MQEYLEKLLKDAKDKDFKQLDLKIWPDGAFTVSILDMEENEYILDDRLGYRVHTD